MARTTISSVGTCQGTTPAVSPVLVPHPENQSVIAPVSLNPKPIWIPTSLTDTKSNFPQNYTPELVDTPARRRSRRSFRPLPWTMDDTPSTNNSLAELPIYLYTFKTEGKGTFIPLKYL